MNGRKRGGIGIVMFEKLIALRNINSLRYWLYLKRRIPVRVTDYGQLLQEGYYSQYGQDKYLVEEIFHCAPGGFFVDIGANDGIHISNTCFLEKKLGWRGVAVEPIPRVFEKLCKNRSCRVVNACVSDQDGEVAFLELDGAAEMLSGIIDKYDKRHLARIEREQRASGGGRREILVPSLTFGTLCDRFGITAIDYLNIDTEGTEFDIIRSIDFTRIRINALTVENNYIDSRTNKFLNRHGFKLIALAGDEIYLHESYSGLLPTGGCLKDRL